MNVIIVGGGKVGSHLAWLLTGEHTVKVIEARRRKVECLQQQEFKPGTIVHGSGTDPLVLEEAGIGGADVVAAVTGADETNLVVTSLARFEFGVPRTIARIKDPRNAWMFTPAMGVDVALNQAELMSRLIVEEMSLGNMMTLLKLQKGEYSVVEEKIHPDAVAVGRTVSELVLPTECILAAVIRGGKLLIPHGDTILQFGDEVLAVVHSAKAAQLAAILGKPE